MLGDEVCLLTKNSNRIGRMSTLAEYTIAYNQFQPETSGKMTFYISPVAGDEQAADLH